MTDNVAARAALLIKLGRTEADFDGDSVEMGDAVNMVADGEVFIAAIEQFMA